MTQTPTTTRNQTTTDPSPIDELIDVAETLAEYLAEAHEADVAADHMGDQTCSYCFTIDRAATIIADVRAELAQTAHDDPDALADVIDDAAEAAEDGDSDPRHFQIAELRDAEHDGQDDDGDKLFICPKCGASDQINVIVTTWRRLDQSDRANFQTVEGEDASEYWDALSAAVCVACDWHGKVADLKGVQ